MTIELKVPMLPESVADATVSAWHKNVGEAVARDENILDLETDKVMLEVPSPVDGVLKEILHNDGDVVEANQIVAIIEEGAAAAPSAEVSAPAAKVPAPAAPVAAKASQEAGPAARRAAAEHSVDVANVKGTGKGGRVTKENVLSASSNVVAEVAIDNASRPEKRVPMNRMRARIAERLLEVTQNTAMLTTFNEVDLTEVMALRKKYKDKFEKNHDVRLGFMSFFIKAAVEALKRFPAVNASIDGTDIVYHGYFDVGVAVSTDRGLVVPVLRNTDQMSMADIEGTIVEYATKARTGKLTLEEMQGGTFSITNGGVFGSLLATPILNAPQSAILGMHKIEERPVVVDGQIVIRPMMYLALSYDHRIIDGKESVSFLVAIKELLEDPARLLLEV